MNTEPRFMTPEEVLLALRYAVGLNTDMGGFDPDDLRTNTPICSLPETYRADMAPTLAGFFFPSGSAPAASPLQQPQAAQVLGAHIAARAQRSPWGTYDSADGAAPERIEEMRRVLADSSSVGGLCNSLSRLVRLTPMEHYAFLDRPCRSGSIFLTLRRRLHERGMSVDELAPSTRLPNLSELGIVIQEAMLIAPKSVSFVGPSALNALMTCGGLLALLSLPVFLCAAMPGAAIGAALFAFAWLRWPGPAVLTYRELCKTLAGEPVARGAVTI